MVKVSGFRTKGLDNKKAQKFIESCIILQYLHMMCYNMHLTAFKIHKNRPAFVD